MAWLSKKNKDKFIGGLIGVGLLALGLWVRSILTEEPVPTTTVTEKHTTVHQVSDSSTQNNISNTVTQHSQGPISNDFSQNKKITNQYFKESKKRRDTAAVVNNGFINEGGTGNTYNQTLNPPIEQRHLLAEHKSFFDGQLVYQKLNFFIEVFYADKESILFGQEIAEYLESKGANQTMKPFGQILAPVPKDKLGTVNMDHNQDTTFVKFTIYPLH